MGKSRNLWGNQDDFGDLSYIEAQGQYEDPEAQVFLEEAHEALSKLSNKANKRGKLMKRPRRAEIWD